MDPTDFRRPEVPGTHAGIAMPAPVAAVEPLLHGLRVAVVVGILGGLLALVAVVSSVPAASHAWEVVRQETEHTLEPVLGEPEHQTLRFLASLVGSDLDETLSVSSGTPH
jgi:hypothetical protein